MKIPAHILFAVPGLRDHFQKVLFPTLLVLSHAVDSVDGTMVRTKHKQRLSKKSNLKASISCFELGTPCGQSLQSAWQILPWLLWDHSITYYDICTWDHIIYIYIYIKKF